MKENSVEDAFFQCQRWILERKEIEEGMGSVFTPETLGERMVKCEGFVTGIMKEEESDERFEERRKGV